MAITVATILENTFFLLKSMKRNGIWQNFMVLYLSSCLKCTLLPAMNRGHLTDLHQCSGYYSMNFLIPSQLLWGGLHIVVVGVRDRSTRSWFEANDLCFPSYICLRIFCSCQLLEQAFPCPGPFLLPLSSLLHLSLPSRKCQW